MKLHISWHDIHTWNVFPSPFAESFLEYICEVPRVLLSPPNPLNFPVPFPSTKISICLLLCCYSCPRASCLAKAVRSRARWLRVSAMWASVLLFLPWACPWAESAHTMTQSLGVWDGNSHTSAWAYLQNSYIVALIALIEKWHYCQWEFYSLHQAKRAMAV